MAHQLALAAACLAAASWGNFSGTYRDSAGKDHPWSVSSAFAVTWDGKPWIPLGPRVTSDEVASLRAVHQDGLNDVLLCFAADQPLQPLVDAAEQAGLAYCLSPKEQAPSTAGCYVMPQSYRVADIHGDADLHLRVPGADWVFYVLADRDSPSLDSTGRANVEGGIANIGVRPKHEGNYVLVLYPHTKSGEMPDYWEGYDAWRDSLLLKLRDTKLGPGFRGLIDPLGDVRQWYDFGRRFIPDSALFRLEFERQLRRKYPDAAKLSLAWRTRSRDFASYQEAAASVPLFAEGRGVMYLWDPTTDVLTEVENGSAYWQDYEAYLKAAALQRAGNLAASLRKVVDVPVVYTWHGWSPVSQSDTAAGQGIGVRGYGKGAAVATRWGAYALGAALTWRDTPWLVASDIAADQQGAAYAADGDPSAAIATLASLGAKGFFVRMVLGDAALKALAAGANHVPPGDQMPKTLEFPEIARWPADILHLPQDVWWIPSPRPGARLDLGDQFDGYRLTMANGTMCAVWANVSEGPVLVRFGDPKKVRVTDYAGGPVETKLRPDGMTVRIGGMPTLFYTEDDLPVPDAAFKETDAVIRAYLKTEIKPGSDITDVKRRYDTALEGFARNPGNAFSILRDLYQTIQGRTGRYVWTEGEKPARTTFGFVATSAAASDGRYLAVDTPFDPIGGSYSASYALNNTSTSTALHLFVAGSLPEGGTLHFQWKLDEGQWEAISPEARSYYGDKFAWYEGGIVTLPPGKHMLTIGLAGAPGAYYDAAIDTVLLTAVPFVPSGIRRPAVSAPKL